MSKSTWEKDIFPLGNRNCLVLQEFAVKAARWSVKHVVSLRHITISTEVTGIIHFRFKLIRK